MQRISYINIPIGMPGNGRRKLATQNSTGHNGTLRLTLLLAALLGGAGGTTAYALGKHDAPAPPAAQQAIPVGVITVRPAAVRTWSEFSGHLRAVDYAEIRPEVGGRIVDIRFKDGQNVKAGDILLVIDPAPYKALVEKAEANLASAETNTQFAKTELDRANGLIATNAISRSLYDQRVNANKVAQAAVDGAQAELTQARLNLDYAYVKAPISGKVSRAEITVGNLVQTGPGAPLLTSIASNDGIYADFEIDEQTYLKDIRAQVAAGQPVAVQIVVPGDEAHPYDGQIESLDNRIDTASGTIRARALLPNKDQSLMAGMTVTVRVADAADDSAMLVPQGAISIDQDKQFVYVVGPDNKVAYRQVTLGKTSGADRIILSGLTAGDKVIVDGLQHVRPDAVVSASEVAAVQPAAGTPLAPAQ